jgi:hypothetical protein
MSSDGNPRGRPSYGASPQQRIRSKLAMEPCTPDDARCGDYTREKLIRMDADFVAQVEPRLRRAKRIVCRPQ